MMTLRWEWLERQEIETYHMLRSIRNLAEDMKEELISDNENKLNFATSEAQRE